jgi:NADH:ubiquinone oxidoreductase subunit E
MSRPEYSDFADINRATQEAIDRLIADHRHSPGAIVAVLRQVHAVSGRLSPPLLDYISAEMSLPLRLVHDVAAFHRRSFQTPEGRHSVKLCTGAACDGRGTGPVLGRIRTVLERKGPLSEDRRFSFDTVRCLGACGMAPVMVVDEDTYGAIEVDQVLEILEKYP